MEKELYYTVTEVRSIIIINDNNSSIEIDSLMNNNDFEKLEELYEPHIHEITFEYKRLVK